MESRWRVGAGLLQSRLSIRWAEPHFEWVRRAEEGILLQQAMTTPGVALFHFQGLHPAFGQARLCA